MIEKTAVPSISDTVRDSMASNLIQKQTPVQHLSVCFGLILRSMAAIIEKEESQKAEEPLT